MPRDDGTLTNSDANRTVLIILLSCVGFLLPEVLLCIMSILGQADSKTTSVITIIAIGCILANSGCQCVYICFVHT